MKSVFVLVQLLSVKRILENAILLVIVYCILIYYNELGGSGPA